MKHLLLLAFLFSIVLETQQVYEGEQWKCIYEQQDGRFHGTYTSFYTNGQKKAEGTFQHNQRSGQWTVWDSTGTLRTQRIYEGPYSFKRIYPKVPDNPVVQLLNQAIYQPTYNKEGYIEWFYLRERMVVWHQRSWDKIYPKNNPLIFDNDRLFKMLDEVVSTQKVDCFSNDTFYDKYKLTNNQLDSLNTSNLEIVSYIIKKDDVFDHERQIYQNFILAICPIVFNPQTQETFRLYWVLFKDFRPYLAKEKIASKNLPPHIHTLDDLFFYNYFAREFFKVSSPKALEIADYKTGDDIQKESERLTLHTIEKEHDIWIDFTKKR